MGKGKSSYAFGKERSQLLKKLQKAEEQLEELEQKVSEKKAELVKPEYQSRYSKLTEIQEEIDGLEEELLLKMEEWEELSERLKDYQ